MNDTPTPRTDELSKGFDYRGLPCLEKSVELSRTIERELTAAREELVEAKQQINIRRSNNLRLDRITREQQELIENLKKLSGARESDCIAMREMASKIYELTEQRDRLAEEVQHYKTWFSSTPIRRRMKDACDEALQSLNQNKG